MATINIGGQSVQVDDKFLSLPPEQQNAAVEEIAKTLGGQGDVRLLAQNTAEPGGMTKAAASGIAKGATGVAGIPGDLSKLLHMGAEKLGLPVEQSNIPGSAEIQKTVEGYTGPLYKPQNVKEEYAQTMGEFVPAMAVGQGGILRRALTQTVLPAVTSETAGQVARNSSVPGTEPYARVVGALASPVVAATAARVAVPNVVRPERQRLVDALSNEGVTSLTAGQVTGNKRLQYLEDAAGNAPGAGSGAERILREGQSQFNEAALRPIGVAGREAPPEVLANNKARLIQNFTDLSARNTLTTDNQFIADLVTAVRRYRNVPDSQQARMVQGYIDDILPHVNSGTMTGAEYQAMRSRMGRQAQNNRMTDPDLSEVLRDMRNALDNAMGRSISPADQTLWNTTRQQYGAQKDVAKAVSRAGEASGEGNIVPANLRNVVAARGADAYSEGRGQFAELARAGSTIMTPLPNSGTAQRYNALQLLNQLTAGAVPAATGRILMSAPVQNYLGGQNAVQRFIGNQVVPAIVDQNATKNERLIRALLRAEAARPQLEAK